jgi:hypothetical protein
MDVLDLLNKFHNNNLNNEKIEFKDYLKGSRLLQKIFIDIK